MPQLNDLVTLIRLANCFPNLRAPANNKIFFINFIHNACIYLVQKLYVLCKERGGGDTDEDGTIRVVIIVIIITTTFFSTC